MAVGLPLKTTYADGDVYSASDVNDTNGTVNAYVTPSLSYSAGKNMIINGAMELDQRNVGASQLLNSASLFTYTLDRWNNNFTSGTSGKLTTGRNLGSVTPPNGFQNYLGYSVTTAATLGSSDTIYAVQYIESDNFFNTGFGSANAKTLTLSFWVRSSLTGTHSGSLFNSAFNRSYVFTYSISAANTWEKKTITIAGDTSGTWLLSGNGIGIGVGFNLGAGSSLLTSTVNAWQGAARVGATGSVQVVSTLNATWYVTGVQLEIGNIASEFSRAGTTIGGEIDLAKRYYQKTYGLNEAVGTTSTGAVIWTQIETSENSRVLVIHQFPVEMRTSPTVTGYAAVSGASGVWYNRSANANRTITSLGTYPNGIAYNTISGTNSAGQQVLVCYTASAEI